MKLLEAYKASALKLSRQVNALYIAAHHRETPWYAKPLIGLVVGYALSPIDLIPDFIPILGMVDDLLLVPVGIYWCIQLVPADVMAKAYQRARMITLKKSLTGAVVIVAIWIAVIAWFMAKLLRYSNGSMGRSSG